MGRPLDDLRGKTFGSLTVLELGPKTRKTAGAWWLCKCKCGAEKSIPASDLKRLKVSSCGCEHNIRIGQAGTTHGKSKTRTYRIWIAMRSRCDRLHQDYSARGIKYCTAWKKFENFLADMGEAPDDCSLDRIDVNGNYEKSNCRWATKEQQANNTRTNIFIEWNGKRQTRSQWEKELNMKGTTLRSRLRAGWPLERAMQPLQARIAGNTPEPAPEPKPVAEPTAAEKLAAAGLTVDELKELLGL